MNLSTAPVVGIPNVDFWPQVFHHHRESQVFVSAFCMKDGGDVRSIGKSFLEHLEALPFDDAAALSKALQALCMEHAEHLFSFSAGFFVADRAILWSLKHGGVHLKRGEKRGLVLQSETLKIVEGKARVGDVFVFGTQGFFSIVPHPLLDAFEHVESLAAAVVADVHRHNNSAHAAAYMLSCQQMDGEKPQDVVSEYLSAPQQKTASKNVLQGMAQGVRGGASWLKARLSAFGPRRVRLERGSKTVLFVAIGVVCALILLISLIVGWSARQAKLREQKIQTLLSPFTQQLSEAKTKTGTDMGAARLLAGTAAAQAQDKLNQTNKKSYEYVRLEKFVKEAQAYYDSISGEKHLDSLPVFFNFQLVKSGFLAKRIKLGGDKLVALDTDAPAAIVLNTAKKQTEILEIGEMSRPADLAFDGKTTYLVTADAVFADGKKVLEGLNSTSAPAFAEVFGNNLYVYAKGSGELLKIARTSSKLSPGVNWLKSAPGLDKGSVTSLAIDGRVWLGTISGNIFVFTQGSKSPFTVKGMPKPFGSSISVFTTSDLEFVYVLEPSAERLVVLKKDGEYVKSFFAKELGAASGFAVSADGKTAYANSGSLVYSINLE